MAYVNTKEMLAKAEEGRYAVGHFNLNNMESVRAFLLAAEEVQSPIILGVSGGTATYMGGYRTITDMVKDFIDFLKITVPVALHVDHGTYEQALAAIEGGFSSVMFDGSKYGIAENIEKTRQIVNLCHQKGITVEAEVGAIGGVEDGLIAMGECADPKECKAIADLGIDMLAAGIGNIHGKYPADWAGLNFGVLAAIQAEIGRLPLVLHGGSGIPDAMVKKAITLGVRKVNVNTECQVAFTDATRKFIEEGRAQVGNGFTPRALLAPGLEASKAKCIEKMQLFGSVGKA
ncbi:MAG: class II fructose-1,6-bisphosphate aldolase [Candidatus Limiplasma sp.]|nr:class II fructose-1,6-bisphosphate aldolase [Candidatus Limiplasma sp.]MEA5145861.1 class II fructose-1,6-bisphosphate aldolase [Candidatus Limiplasma sp.]